jgi:hypothetical protein
MTASDSTAAASVLLEQHQLILETTSDSMLERRFTTSLQAYGGHNSVEVAHSAKQTLSYVPILRHNDEQSFMQSTRRQRVRSHQVRQLKLHTAAMLENDIVRSLVEGLDSMVVDLLETTPTMSTAPEFQHRRSVSETLIMFRNNETVWPTRLPQRIKKNKTSIARVLRVTFESEAYNSEP